MWFASFLEKDKVFRTRRETLWRKVQLNRVGQISFPTFLADCLMPRRWKNFWLSRPKIGKCILHIVGKLEVKTAITLLLPDNYDHQYKYQQFLLSRYLMPTLSTVCSSCWLQMTTGTSHSMVSCPFFWAGLLRLLAPSCITYWHMESNHRSDTPVTLAIPAKGSFSSSSLSIKALVSCLITLFFGSKTNCLSQSLHKKILVAVMNEAVFNYPIRFTARTEDDVFWHCSFLEMSTLYPYLFTTTLIFNPNSG